MTNCESILFVNSGCWLWWHASDNKMFLEAAFRNSVGSIPLAGQSSLFFSIDMNYTLNKKYNKHSSPFDIYLFKWGKNEKYKFYIY